MNYPNRISYTLRRGDTLYKIAQRYRTTVEVLQAENPHVSPGTLHPGDVITIVPGATQSMATAKPQTPPPPPMPPVSNYTPVRHMTHTAPAAAVLTMAIDPPLADDNGLLLNKMMRMRWVQHVMWTRAYILSALHGIGDQQAVTNRVLRTAPDIAQLFSPYMGEAFTRQLTQLLTEHINLFARIVQAIRLGNMEMINEVTKELVTNADAIAALFCDKTSCFDCDAMRRMLYEHVELTKVLAMQRREQRFADDIATYDKIEQQALEMADTFTKGLLCMKNSK